jgi:hypothetical protein
MAICEVTAYKRLYILCAKKKINIFSLFFAFFLMFTSVPLKILKILYFIISREGLLKNNFLEFFYINYNNLYGKKIEIINKQIYVNCSTRVDIIKKIYNFNPKKSPEEIFNIYKKLINIVNGIDYKNTNRTTTFVLGTLMTEEGVRVKKAH